MSTDEKITAVLETISQDIARHRKAAENAMLSLEYVNVAEDEYKKANTCFCQNQFIVGYLSHIKEVIAVSDIKFAEVFIRFHAYFQYKNGSPDDGLFISTGRAEVASLLDGYIATFFGA